MITRSRPAGRAPSRLGRVAAIVAVGLAGFVAGCGGGGEARKPDAAPSNDAPVVNTDASPQERPYGDTVAPLKTNGQPCADESECVSGFCAEGVCCDRACTEACYTCTAAGVVGTCAPADLGPDPRGRCPTQDPATCGTTGNCDGTGACQRYALGVTCQSPGCTGSTLTSSGTCSATGTCEGATSQSCAPYMCGANGQCRTTCSINADCTAGNACVNGSCGKLPPGGSCSTNDQCQSSICAQGVCCMTACTGTCRSCALPGSAGTCANVPAGMDPEMNCTASDVMTCDLDGECDGMGGCRNHPATTSCSAGTCSMGTATLPGRCDGVGMCLAGMTQSCAPYACGTNGACRTSCATSADCATGFVCTGSICTRLPNGSPCAAGSECASGNCEQGVCCNVACNGTCMACNLTGSVGLCSAIPDGMPPLAASQCTASAASTCGNDGTCNGAGACRQHAAGTICAAATCTGSTLTPARTCDGMGLCQLVTSSSCAPYNCGTAAACRITCTTNADCTSGNSCVGGSCGKLPPGAPCTMATQCESGFCAQGVCCNEACAGTCRSCAITGSVGTCSNVAAGQPAPTGQCTMAAASTCGNDGTCNGLGACRRYVTGTQCAAGSCTGSTYTPPRLCDGAGVCGMVSTSSCTPYACNSATGACRTACTTDAECVAPNVCNAGSCGKKPQGSVCTTAAECASNFCAQGRCCDQACTGTCRSCALAGNLGTCTNIPNGMPPVTATQCPATAATTCGTDGVCNGMGACRIWADGTICAMGGCSGSTLTPNRTCNGAGVCRTVTSTLCDPYACNTTGGTCRTTCTTTADCAAPNTCLGGSCGKLPNAAACTMAAQCNSGFCAQGVCCNAACTGTCVSCALTGTVGTCTSVPAGQPSAQCTDQGVATCGTDGTCDGSGACRRYPVGTTCVAATCTGSTLTPAATCNASNSCVTPATVSCGRYTCGTGACRTTCTSDSHCTPPNICAGGACVPSTNLRVELKTITQTGSSWISPHFRIFNVGTTSVPYSELTVRYWYTLDMAANSQTSNCDYSAVSGNCSSIAFGASSFVAVPGRMNADYYFQFGFTTAAGSLAANGGGGHEIQLRWAKPDTYPPFDQMNDYSFNGSTSFAVTTRVTVYRNGFLVYGTEPPAP